MQKIFLALLFSLLAAATSAQKLGYYREANGMLNYTSYKVTADDAASGKISGLCLDMRVSYSILGSLIFRDTEKKFFIGDHIGVGFGMGYFKKTNDDVPYMVPFNLEYGLKAAYSINDDLEVGVKYVIGGNYFTDFKNDFGFGHKPAIIPSARFKNYMGSVGFGKASVGESGSGDPGNYLRLEGRIIFGDAGDGDSHTCIFFRAENYTGKSDGEFATKRTVSQLSFGFGIM